MSYLWDRKRSGRPLGNTAKMDKLIEEVSRVTVDNIAKFLAISRESVANTHINCGDVTLLRFKPRKFNTTCR